MAGPGNHRQQQQLKQPCSQMPLLLWIIAVALHIPAVLSQQADPGRALQARAAPQALGLGMQEYSGCPHPWHLNTV